MVIERLLHDFAWYTALALDFFGLLIIVIGLIVATIHAARHLKPKRDTYAWFRRYRHNMARSLLVGLEFLLAADIIRTVAGGRFTLESIAVLAVIVGIRILLGISIEAEMNGKWPEWRHLFRRPTGQAKKKTEK